jgi:hypothetical protein
VPEDPLEGLLLDADEVDRTQLAEALAGTLGVDSSTGRLVLKPGFNELDAARKILAYLLGGKAAVLLGKLESEAVSPALLSKETGMPRGTVNPKLSQLHEQRLVSKTKAGSYYVAPHQLVEALTRLRQRSTE